MGFFSSNKKSSADRDFERALSDVTKSARKRGPAKTYGDKALMRRYTKAQQALSPQREEQIRREQMRRKYGVSR